MSYDCQGRKKRVFRTDFTRLLFKSVKMCLTYVVKTGFYQLNNFLKNYLLISVFTRFYYVQ